MLMVEYLDFSFRFAAVVMPLGLYFLILGLLNSRSTPQVLSGRLDFTLLITALCPLLVVPCLYGVGVSAVSVAWALAGVAGVILLLAPRGRSWVVYNITAPQARGAAESALDALGLSFTSSAGSIQLADDGGAVRLSAFPMLRNVSIRFEGSDELARNFGVELARALGARSAETSPTTSALLLLATGMLIAPLAMVANHAGEIVRILTDLLN